MSCAPYYANGYGIPSGIADLYLQAVTYNGERAEKTKRIKNADWLMFVVLYYLKSGTLPTCYNDRVPEVVKAQVQLVMPELEGQRNAIITKQPQRFEFSRACIAHT